jgi:Ser/Thr protein kinase RdoA (MazF antagonist)
MNLDKMVQGTKSNSIALELIHLWEHDIDSLKFWRASSNYVYRFEKDAVRYFLRLTNEEDRTREQIEAELDFMQFLNEQGYPAVHYIPSKSGARLESRDTEIGTVHAVVFSQAVGMTVELTAMSEQQLVQWGCSLATLHKLSESYSQPVEASPRMSHLDVLLFISSVLREHPNETAAASELERMNQWLSSLPISVEDYGLIHYDFELDNVFWDERLKRFSVIDFDDAMYHWYVMDIVSTVRDLNVGEEEELTQSLELFLQGYRSVKPISDSLLQQYTRFQRFNDLYGFARVLRSLENSRLEQDPPWLIKLHAKLTLFCDRARESFQKPF